MAALATALGRGLAPYLKSLVPCWWLAQFDGYAEAAAAARAGLAAAFPASKQRDVLLFCRSEVRAKCRCEQGACGTGAAVHAAPCFESAHATRAERRLVSAVVVVCTASPLLLLCRSNPHDSCHSWCKPPQLCKQA